MQVCYFDTLQKFFEICGLGLGLSNKRLLSRGNSLENYSHDLGLGLEKK